MPLSELFASRVHYFEELPFIEAYPLFDAPISKYDSPALDTKSFGIPNQNLKVPVLVHSPLASASKLPIVIWMHGGGFQQGTYLMNEGDVVARELVVRGNVVVVNVEYRLVTETLKFPAPQNDCMAVLEWVATHADEIGGDASNIFVGGVSAGGCLAATMAVLDRDNGNNFIKGQLLNCPVLHHELPVMSQELAQKMAEVPAQLAFTPEMIREINSFAIATGSIQDAEEAWWPGETASKAGLPIAQIINCEYDSLRASGEQYARQLLAANVEVDVVTQAGVPHAHLNRLPADCNEVVETLSKIISFIDKVAGR